MENTNQVLQAISDRRSIRDFTEDALTEDQLQAVISAALASPSARNAQPWHLSVTRDRDLLAEINKSAQSSRADIFYSAPVVIFVSIDDANYYARFDCGIVCENITLAAHSLGLGSVILGLPKPAFEGADKERFGKALSFPEGYVFGLAVAVGVPSKGKEAHPVKDGLVSYAN